MKRSLLLGTCLLVGACSTSGDQTNLEYLPEMIDSVPYDAFSPNAATPDGKTWMAPPTGAIARGFMPMHLAPGPEQAQKAGRELQNPLLTSAEHVARGKVLYGRFCVPCHGATGQGDGPVIPRFPTPPPLTATHAKAMPEGQMFHVITFGQGLMPAHGSQIARGDRWKIVLYLRSMQGGSP